MDSKGVFKGKTVLITGASRGIGFAIAKKLAADGANIIVTGRHVESRDGESRGTVLSAAKEIEDAGGHCLPLQLDVTNDDDIKSVIDKVIEKFGAIDILINNCSHLVMVPARQTTIENFDKMHRTITRGVFVMTKLCYPHLKKSSHAHILNMSPPINMDPVWFKLHAPYTAAKYSVSMYTIGMAQEFKDDNIAVNSLWPKIVTYSSHVAEKAGSDAGKYCRKVDTMADAAYAILMKKPPTYTGNTVLDEDVLKAEGITNFDAYKFSPESTEKLWPDLFTDEVPDFGHFREKL